ncbi:hypothetical protein Tco_1521596, partial [Tanacetum coccineum]
GEDGGDGGETMVRSMVIGGEDGGETVVETVVSASLTTIDRL